MRRLLHPVPTVAVLAVLLGGEAAASVLLVADARAEALALHATCIGAAGLACWRRSASGPRTATVQMTALLLPFLGPLAAGAGLLVLLAVARSRDPAADPAHWHEHLFPNLAADELSEQAEAIGRQQPDTDTTGEIESFHDVLRWGSLLEQEHVLSLVSRSFRPEFASVLRAGLAADELGLRAQAAAGLSLLETRISAGIAGLEAEHRAAGPAERDAVAVRLAFALADAAHSGLYDDARTAEMRGELVALLTPLAGRTGTDPSVYATLGRTLIQLGQLDRAAGVLADADPNGAGGDSALAWLLEVRFRQGNFAQMRDLLAGRAGAVRAMEGRDGPLAPALRFWGEAA